MKMLRSWFGAAPVRVPGGTGSPLNAIASF